MGSSSPLLGEEGWPRQQTVRRRGRGGHSGLTTPSALSKWLRKLRSLLIARPLLSQEETTFSKTFKLPTFDSQGAGISLHLICSTGASGRQVTLTSCENGKRIGDVIRIAESNTE